MTNGARRTVGVALVDWSRWDRRVVSPFGFAQGRLWSLVVGRLTLIIRFGLRGFASCCGERLRLLAAVAIDGDCLEAKLPSLDVGFGDFIHGGRLGQVDRLAV